MSSAQYDDGVPGEQQWKYIMIDTVAAINNAPWKDVIMGDLEAVDLGLAT